MFVPIRFHRYPVCSHACFWQNPSHESARSGDRFTSRVRESARERESEIAVVDVLGYDFPGRLVVLYDGNGSECGGCNVLDQVQANRWAVCDAKSLGLPSHSLQ